MHHLKIKLIHVCSVVINPLKTSPEYTRARDYGKCIIANSSSMG